MKLSQAHLPVEAAANRAERDPTGHMRLPHRGDQACVYSIIENSQIEQRNPTCLL